MVKVENVTKKYGGFTAVDNISFEIQDGEIVGFLGKNGAGKSTTMNMMTGCIEATEGEIEINGYNISRKPKKAKREIGYMPEGVPLYYDMTVKEFVNYIEWHYNDENAEIIIDYIKDLLKNRFSLFLYNTCDDDK